MLNVQRAEKMAANLTEADLAKPVYSAEGPEWTVKDVFAHLASWGNQPVFFIGMAQRAMSSGGGAGPGFDINAFNNQQVDARKDKTIFELLAEFRQGHEKGVELIASTAGRVADVQDAAPVPGWNVDGAGDDRGRLARNHEAQHLMDIAPRAAGVVARQGRRRLRHRSSDSLRLLVCASA